MASRSPPQTILDLFKPSKRLKRIVSDTNPKPTISLTSSSSLPESKNSDSSSPALTAEQKSRIQFNKSLANSRRNLKICSQLLSESSKGYVKLEELLVEETWKEVLPGEFQKPYAKKLCKFVEGEVCGGAGVPIFPPLHLIFNALNTTSFDQVKAVIIGQDPYHGPGQAMGLSFSVPKGVKIPSSLVNIYKELQKDVNFPFPMHGDLEKWAIEGVLLLNTVLTVRQHQANSHARKGWEQFTDAVIEAISQKKTGVVFLLWGNNAQAKARLIDGTKHHILKAAHPSGLSANRGFFGCRHFSQTNKILEKMGIAPISWNLSSQD